MNRPEPDGWDGEISAGRRRVAIGALLIIAVAAAVALATVDRESLVTAAGPLARAAFVLLVIMEVVLAPIPGGVIAFLASAAWGFWQSWPLHYVGNVIGGLLVFWLARSLGKPFVDRHVNPERRERVERWLFGRPWLIWIVYAVPVFPIDTISIVLALSRLRRRRFAAIIVTALPFYTGITAALGAYFGQYIPYLEWFGIVVFVLFLAALVYGVYRLRAPESG